MKPSLFFGTRAISPAIATIILVAVILVVAVSSAFYYTIVVVAYSSFEGVEVRNVKVYPVDNLEQSTNNVLKGAGWKVSITLKNTGTKQATITSVLLNGKPLDTYERIAVFDGTGYAKTSQVSITITS